MALEITAGTPLANALQGVVQPKLAEFGWTTGDEDDSTLSEYIILMLVNGKGEDQIATELANDLLDLGPESPETKQFAHWLFEQIDQLQQQLNGVPQASANGPDSESYPNDSQADAMEDVPATNNSAAAPAANDTDMEGSGEGAPPQGAPTGPKAMRNGSSSKAPRDKRMINNINRQMDRTDDALHRVRGSGSSGRINSHSSRDPPKGPRSSAIGRGIQQMAAGRGMGQVNVGMPGMPSMNGSGTGMGMPQMPMPNMTQGGGLNPQQQIQLMQMYEQTAQMMQGFLNAAGNGAAPSTYINPKFANNGKGPRKPYEKGSRQGNKQHTHSTNKVAKDGDDEAMTDAVPTTEMSEGMDTDSPRPGPFDTMCKFNLRCSKADCPFAHQSPSAPFNAPQTIDMASTCDFGVKCSNKKCQSKHPSPALRQQHQAEQICMWYPNCREGTNCPFKHPTTAPCRNGADCTEPNCQFYHSEVKCKFNPCTNRYCQFKHDEGQKKLGGNVWTAAKNGADSKEHVSERKFVDEGAQEELIIPGQAASANGEAPLAA